MEIRKGDKNLKCEQVQEATWSEIIDVKLNICEAKYIEE